MPSKKKPAVKKVSAPKAPPAKKPRVVRMSSSVSGPVTPGFSPRPRRRDVAKK